MARDGDGEPSMLGNATGGRTSSQTHGVGMARNARWLRPPTRGSPKFN
jgi:hypothetical protein